MCGPRHELRQKHLKPYGAAALISLHATLQHAVLEAALNTIQVGQPNNCHYVALLLLILGCILG